MIQKLKKLIIGSGGLRTELARGAIASFGLKSINALLGLALSILLARALEPEGFGIYAFAISLMTLLAVPVQLGFPTLLVRQVSRYHQAGQNDLLKGILQRSNQAVLLLALLVGITAIVIAWLLESRINTIQRTTFFWALLLLPLATLNQLRQATLQGLLRVVQGQLPEAFIQPSLMLILVGIATFVGWLTPPRAMAINCVVTGVAFLLGTMMLIRVLPQQIRTTRARYDTSKWLQSILPLSLLAGLNVINGQTDILMLGLLGTDYDIGLYKVALAGASLVIFTLTAVNTVLAPHVSRMYNAGDNVRLQYLVTKSARIIFIVALPVAAILIVFGEAIIGFAYGSAYISAHIPLAILCLGQLVNAGMGSVVLILNMSGYEREAVKGVAFSSVANVLLNALLIPLYGTVGAALASLVTLIMWNAILSRKIWVLLSIESTAYCFRSKKKNPF